MENGEKTFLYNGIKIKYDEMGTGDPMILLHGFGVSSYTWHLISKPLSQKNKLFLIDLKGFGLSDKPSDNKYAISDQVDIILSFIQKNDLRNLVLVGHSMGGAVALQTVLRSMKTENNPVKGLILIDSPAYKQKLPEFMQFLTIPFFNKFLPAFFPARFGTKMMLKKCFFDDTKITEEMVKNYSRFNDPAGSSHAFIATANRIIPENIEKITSQYKEIQIPVLMIWGENDRIIPLDIGKRLEQSVPGSKLVVIPDCGHIPTEEKPEKTVEIISDFLKRI